MYFAKIIICLGTRVYVHVAAFKFRWHFVHFSTSDKSFVERLCEISRSITARISRPVIKKCRVPPRSSARMNRRRRTSGERTEEKTSVTQSNTARLIRRKLRGCLPLFINFNSARGPPTEGVPPLATSVRGPSVKRGAGLSLRSSLRTERLPRKIAINRCQADDPKIRSLVQDT
jgi:hypothetical protein